MSCYKFKDLRLKYLPSKYVNNPNLQTFSILMSSAKTAVIQSLSLYLYHAFMFRQTSLDTDLYSHTFAYMLYLIVCKYVICVMGRWPKSQ